MRPFNFYSLAAIFLATLSYSKASLDRQPKFILKAESNKAFHNSSLVKTVNIESGNIAECLEHCLQDCRCQSFQICQNTKCQLCSSHKEGNSSLLHDKDGCVYATYEMRQSTKTFQVIRRIFEIFFSFFTPCISQRFRYQKQSFSFSETGKAMLGHELFNEIQLLPTTRPLPKEQNM